MEEEEIKFLGYFQKLKYEPGDVIIIKCPYVLRPDQRERLYDNFRLAFPNAPLGFLILLEDGLDIGIISSAPECPPES